MGDHIDLKEEDLKSEPAGLNVTEKDLEEMEELNKQYKTTRPEELNYTITHVFFIAGVQHHQMHEVMNVLKPNIELILVPEPDNKYDPNAVKIELHIAETSGEQIIEKQTMLGYVPKKFSSEVVAKFAAGRTLQCIIVGFYPEAKSWERCYVEIRQIKE